jgi:peptide/nickel transport system permease protein
MRLLHAFLSRMLSLIMILCICFIALESLPGDACTAFLAQDAQDPQLLNNCRVELGINQPILIRFGKWTNALLHGDLGKSLTQNRPVAEVIMPPLRNTVLLATFAALVAIPLSMVLGVVAAIWRGSIFDIGMSALFLIAMTLPEFLIATVLIFIFSISLQWLPAITAVPTDASILEMLPNVVLPVAVLSLVMVAPKMQVVRTRVIATMQSDFAEASRLRGLSFSRVLFGHVLPGALPPVLNAIALSMASLLGGVVVIERVFNYPGLGTLTLQAIHDRDMPVVQAVVVIFTLTFIVLTLLADLLSALVDPRVAHGSARQ